MRRARERAQHTSRSVAGRTLVVLFICAGIAFFGLLAGGDHRLATARLQHDPMDGYFGVQMPRYPGVQEVPAGPASTVGKARVRMSFFATADEPAKVARFYSRYWRQRSYYVREDITHVGGVVSAVDVEQGRIYQVMISTRGERTMAFPSVTTSPLRAMETDDERALSVPLFPESKAVINLGSKEGNVNARVSLSTNSGGLGENVDHYRRELRNRGFVEEAKQKEEELGPGQRVLLFRKGSREITVNLTAMDPAGKRVRVHIMEVGS